jgi:small subunit ribosomal protein S16
MALKIRLTRLGARNKPFYRVVVAESQSRRDGRFIEKLGFYDPTKNPVQLDLNYERAMYWIQRGAQPSETVKSLIKKIKDVLPSATAAASQSEEQPGKTPSETPI